VLAARHAFVAGIVQRALARGWEVGNGGRVFVRGIGRGSPLAQQAVKAHAERVDAHVFLVEIALLPADGARVLAEEG